MWSRREAQAFQPDDVKLLQQCFDVIVAKHFLESRSERAEEIASALILAFKRGVRERVELIRLADVPAQTAGIEPEVPVPCDLIRIYIERPTS